MQAGQMMKEVSEMSLAYKIDFCFPEGGLCPGKVNIGLLALDSWKGPQTCMTPPIPLVI